jgi:hypothetical protein
MTTDAAFKRRVRARMRKTGERYATARRHVDAEQGAARRPAAATRPLLAIGSNPLHAFAGASVQLTPAGGEVLAGRADHLRLNGVDRWIGGTHLTGTEPSWRYDERLETLIQVEGFAAGGG